MAVAHDAATMGGSFSGASPHTVAHTPVGTPKGVVVFVTQGGTSAQNDTITGVTYGGVAMTRVATNGWAADTSGEVGGAFCYFLGSGIPTGAQDVVVSTNGGSAVKIVYVLTMTAAANTEVAVSGKVENDAADPQVVLNSGTDSALRYAAIYSGHGAVASLTGLNTAVASHDWGNFVTLCERQASASTGSVTMGWTATIDDVAMTAVAIKEVAGGGGTSITLTPATETDTAVALSLTHVKTLTPAAETDTAQALALTITRTLTPATETDTAVALSTSLATSVTLTPATEADTAQPLVLTRHYTLTPATETDEAQALALERFRTLVPALEADEAVALSYGAPVTPATYPSLILVRGKPRISIGGGLYV